MREFFWGPIIEWCERRKHPRVWGWIIYICFIIAMFLSTCAIILWMV